MGNELYHHGILGQKWGKKNGPPYPLSKSKMSRSERANYHEDYKEAHSGKSYKQMSTAELNRVNNRLQAEQNYLRLTQSNTSKGKKAIKALKTANDAVSTVVATEASYQAGKKLVEKLAPKLIGL